VPNHKGIVIGTVKVRCRRESEDRPTGAVGRMRGRATRNVRKCQRRPMVHLVFNNLEAWPLATIIA